MTFTDSDRSILLEIEQDCREAEYEAHKACWKDCIVFDGVHTELDREWDRREDQAIAAGIPFLTQEEMEQFTGPFGEWCDLSAIDPDQLPFD